MGVLGTFTFFKRAKTYLQSVPLPMIQRRLQDFGPWVNGFTFKGEIIFSLGPGLGIGCIQTWGFFKKGIYVDLMSHFFLG